MDKPCLNDKNEYPDDKVLSRHLGDVKITWDAFNDILKQQYPSITGEWRYYNDGKSWLFKVTKKKKTICWISVHENMYKTAFYFPDRAEELITGSTLGKEYIDQFINGKRYGKIRAVVVETTKSSDLNTVKILIDIKEKLK